MSSFGGRDMVIFWTVSFIWKSVTWLATPILVLRDVRKSHPGDIIFRQDVGKALAKLSILFALTSFFGVGLSWHFLSNGIPDSQCQMLLDKQLVAIAIGAVVGVFSCVAGPLIMWRWPWSWLLVLDLIIFTSILTAGWGDWGTVTWQAGIVVVFNIGAGIAYMKARRYAMTLWTAISISISVDFTGQLVTRIDLPIYRRLDAWWCQCATQCGFRIISVTSIVLLFLVYNASLQYVMNQQEIHWRRAARFKRFDNISKKRTNTEIQKWKDANKRRLQQRAEQRAKDKMARKQAKRDAQVNDIITAGRHTEARLEEIPESDYEDSV